jgi:replicative DNA helicase
MAHEPDDLARNLAAFADSATEVRVFAMGATEDRRYGRSAVSAYADSPPAAPAVGATPPHSLEAERSVLGAILLSDKTLYTLVIDEGLQDEDFYRERHAVVYRAILDLYNENEPIDVLTVTEYLRSNGHLDDAGGAAAVDELAAAVPAAGNARRYAQIVREHALMRRLLATTYAIQSQVINNEALPRDIVEQAERAMFEVAHDERTKDFAHVGDVLHHEIQIWQDLASGKQSLTGTPSGFSDLDEITGGFQPGNLIIIAARPSMGKSALVTNIAEHVALHKTDPRPVALFSLEMAESELAMRFIASRARIKGDDLRKGRLKEERKWKLVLDAAEDYSNAPLHLDDSSDISLLEIRAKARRLHSQMSKYGGLGMIIVDYLQLLRPDGRIESRVEQVGQMSRGLKILARELKVPVIALSQLSRGVESRTDKRPLLSDLRESGQIEQDADLVVFIYRDEYYNPDTTERPGEADLIIAKHRNGGLGEVPLVFQGEFTRFMNRSPEM